MTASGSRHLVDPELIGLLDSFPSIHLTPETLPTVRALSFETPVDPAAIEAVEMTTRTVPGPNGAPDVGVVIYRPKGASGAAPCIFHVHGGGYVLGAAAAGEATQRPLAAALGCAIVSVEYRLAPETAYPGAVEDAYAALGWLNREAANLGVDTQRTGVMGESAGGGLAAALALMARDRGEHAFSFQHLIYPMLDDRTCTTADPHPVAGEFLWTTHNNHFGWSALLGAAPGGEGVSCYAAAARADDVSRLPPTFISTGALDLFLEEDLEYARRLMRAGVPVELHVYPGAFHAFDMDPAAAVSAQGRRDSHDALRRALARRAG